MSLANYEKDRAWSRKCEPFWNSYYNSVGFEVRLQALIKRGHLSVKRIDRSDNPLFQSMSYLDAVILLSDGRSLLVDEKNSKFNPQYGSNYPVEVVSNPNKTPVGVGWGYHKGVVIAAGKFSLLPNGDPEKFAEEPLLFSITEQFIDEVVRNPAYTVRVASSTDGLYSSIFKPVPKEVLRKYWP